MKAEYELSLPTRIVGTTCFHRWHTPTGNQHRSRITPLPYSPIYPCQRQTARSKPWYAIKSSYTSALIIQKKNTSALHARTLSCTFLKRVVAWWPCPRTRTPRRRHHRRSPRVQVHVRVPLAVATWLARAGGGACDPAVQHCSCLFSNHGGHDKAPGLRGDVRRCRRRAADRGVRGLRAGLALRFGHDFSCRT